MVYRSLLYTMGKSSKGSHNRFTKGSCPYTLQFESNKQRRQTIKQKTITKEITNAVTNTVTNTVHNAEFHNANFYLTKVLHLRDTNEATSEAIRQIKVSIVKFSIVHCICNCICNCI